MNRLSLLSACLLVISGIGTSAYALPAPVTLQQTDTVAYQLGGAAVTRQGSISQLGRVEIEQNKGKKVQISEVSNRIFQDFEAASSELNRSHARFGLSAKPVTEDWFGETSDRFVIARRISFKVKDFAKASKSKFLTDFAISKDANVPTPKLDDSEKAAFLQYKAEIRGRAANDPLRQALEKDGEDGLMNAIFQGLDGITIEEVRTVFKTPIAVLNGKARFPSLEKNGPTREVPRKHTTALEAMKKKLGEMKEREGRTGNHTDSINEDAWHNGKKSAFLTGFTVDRSYPWSKSLSFAKGAAGIKLYTDFGYTLGFRVPVEITSHMDPTEIKVYAPSTDSNHVVNAELTGYAGNKDDDFYRSAGYTGNFAGKEVPLYGYAKLGAKAWILSKEFQVLDKTFDIDLGFDLKVPFGSQRNFEFYRNSSDGWKVAAIWVPSRVTRTVLNLSVLGKLEVKLGVGLPGEGTTKIRCNFLTQKYHTRTGYTVTTGQTQLLNWSNSTKQNCPIPVGELGDLAYTNYGFKLSHPEYDVNTKLAPMVKPIATLGWGPISVEWSKVFTFDRLAIDLTTLEFNAHANTNRSYTYMPGKKDKGTVEKKRAPVVPLSSDAQAKPVKKKKGIRATGGKKRGR